MAIVRRPIARMRAPHAAEVSARALPLGIVTSLLPCGLLAGGWGPDWPSGYGWGWALFDGKSIVPAGNTNIGELNDPQVNKWFLQMEAASSQTERNAISHQIDMQVMKDAVILPATYNKALLYRSPNLANVNVNSYYGMYDYGTLGMKK